MTPALVVLVAILSGIVIGALRMSYRMQAAEREILQYLGNGGEWYGLELVQASEAKRGAIRRGTVYVILNSLEDRLSVVSRIPPAPGIELVSWPVFGREESRDGERPADRRYAAAVSPRERPDFTR